MNKYQKRLALEKKEASSLKDIIKLVLNNEHLTTAFNTQKVFSAWDIASGAEKYTVKRFFRDGRLYVTLDSSVVRSQLLFQREALLERINQILNADELFTPQANSTRYVKELIIK